MARPGDALAKIDLLRAAETEFAEHGLDRTRIEDITARAGRSKGSFYLHFQSKDEAFREIVESMLARLGATLDRCDRDFQAEMSLGVTRERFLEAWLDVDTELFEIIWQNRGISRMVLGGLRAEFHYMVAELSERSRENVVRFLKRGITLGLFAKDLDVEISSFVLSGAYDALARQLINAPKKPDLRAWLANVQRLILHGISATARMSQSPSDQRVSHLSIVSASFLKNSSGNSSGSRPSQSVGPVGKKSKRVQP